MAKHAMKKRELTMPAAIGIGAGVGLLITLIGGVLLAFLLAGEKLAIEAMGYGVLIAQFVGALLGAMAASWCYRQRRMIVCLVTAGVYMLVLMAVNAIFFGGQYEGVGGSLLVVAIAGSAAAFVGNGGGKMSKHRKKFRVNGKIAQ